MSNFNYCGVRTEPNVVLNCNNTRVIRVDRVYFGATPSLKCPPPHNCGTFDIEETGRFRINCNRRPTCTSPANFPLVDCEGQMINSTSIFVTYQCVQGKQILGLLHRENCVAVLILKCNVRQIFHPQNLGSKILLLMNTSCKYDLCVKRQCGCQIMSFLFDA